MGSLLKKRITPYNPHGGRMKKIIPFLLLAIMLVACSSKPAGPTDPEQAIEVRPGEEFTLILQANPTTGYHWEIVKGSLDENLVQFVNQEYQSSSDPGLVGGGGVDLWTFKALKPGETKITLGYYPPSNTPTDPEQTQTFSLKIK
jgi:inhibitor of cysteine peptidase